MAEQWKNPPSDDNRPATDEDDQLRGVAEEGDEAFEDDEDLDDEEDEEEGETF
jgi:hypothetical protein